MASESWHDLGDVEELKKKPLQELTAGRTRLAVSYVDGVFGVLANACNHVGGPLGLGRLDGDYVVCPWHYWKFHAQTGLGEPGYEADAVPAYRTRIEGNRLLVDLESATRRSKMPHAAHPLARPIERGTGSIRVVGIATTAMTKAAPRYSTSDALLNTALEHARLTLAAETQLIQLRDLNFRECEGFYSKAARACTWPCSITQMDPNDQLDRVYEAFVHWADVILVATPIRWGAAGSLYYKMVERMNCVQNQETIAGKHMMQNKVAAFIITGGQDNIQGVAGQLLGFFAEIGCQFPPYPYIAHSRGWSAEDMENNERYVRDSKNLHDGARELVARAVDTASKLLAARSPTTERAKPVSRGGRKAHQLDVKAQI